MSALYISGIVKLQGFMHRLAIVVTALQCTWHCRTFLSCTLCANCTVRSRLKALVAAPIRAWKVCGRLNAVTCHSPRALPLSAVRCGNPNRHARCAVLARTTSHNGSSLEAETASVLHVCPLTVVCRGRFAFGRNANSLCCCCHRGRPAQIPFILHFRHHEGAPRYAARRSRSLNTPPAVTSAPAPGPLRHTKQKRYASTAEVRSLAAAETQRLGRTGMWALWHRHKREKALPPPPSPACAQTA